METSQELIPINSDTQFYLLTTCVSMKLSNTFSDNIDYICFVCASKSDYSTSSFPQYEFSVHNKIESGTYNEFNFKYCKNCDRSVSHLIPVLWGSQFIQN